jgi:hypothetical protein
MAANTFFVAIWNNPNPDNEFVFDESKKCEPPKNLWKKLEKEIVAGGFTEGQIFEDGKEATHDMCAYCEKEMFKAKSSTIQDWQNSFTKITISKASSKSLIEPEQIMKMVLAQRARTKLRLLPG